MRLVYMGTAEIAVPVLHALIGAGHEIPLAVTAPDSASSRRGLKKTPSPVAIAAGRLGIEVFSPERIRDPIARQKIIDAGASALVVCAYGQLLDEALLKCTPLGAINVHASLLPSWRGAAPIARCLMNGDAQTGVTVMAMDAGLDTGAILLSQEVSLGQETTAGELADLLGGIAGPLLSDALQGLASASLAPRPQPEEGASYAAKITAQDRIVTFREPSLASANRIRALDPLPGAYGILNGSRVQFFGAGPGPGFPPGKPPSPGEIFPSPEGMLVACPDGLVRIREVKPEGKARISARAFVNGLRGQKLAFS